MGQVSADIWSEDFWKLSELTDAINILPYVPSMCKELGIFAVEPITTTSVLCEYANGTVQLVPNTKRGAPATPNKTDVRTGRTFEVAHLALGDTVKADDVQNVRAFGKVTKAQTVQGRVNDKMQEMKNKLDATKEFHRMGALRGTILDADGSTEILNLFTEFNISEPTQNFDFSSDSDDVRVQCMALTRTIAAAINGYPFYGVGVFCSDSWYDKLISHASVKEIYKYHAGAIKLGDNLAYDTFDFANCRFINYRGAVSSQDFVVDDQARAFPLGANGLYKEYYAPADYEDTVNTPGLPFYASSERLPHNKGREIECQSNPLMVCHRPQSLIKLTMTTV